MATNSQIHFVRGWWSNWSSQIRSAFSRDNHGASSSRQNLVESATSSNVRTATSDYTELMGGSVPCPSCNGSGLIPKELESTLVALIPVNDERLKPKRTWLYISFWIIVCIIIGGILLFLFMPRTVVLSSNEMPIEIVHVYDRDNITASYIDFYFLNTVNVSSGNYLPVSVLNITATIISKFQPWSMDVVGYGENETFSQTTPLDLYRNTRELSFNNTVSLKGFAAEYCQATYSRLTSLYVTLQFDLAVTLRYYYGHQEQVTTSTQQQVCCIPTGNCTSPN